MLSAFMCHFKVLLPSSVNREGFPALILRRVRPQVLGWHHSSGTAIATYLKWEQKELLVLRTL